MSWSGVSLDSRDAARELLKSNRFRSSVSRSYYSLYSEITGHLVKNKVAFKNGRANPTHSSLSKLVVNNLGGMNEADKRVIKSVVSRLYNLRVFADYFPGLTTDKETARRALGDLHTAIRILEKRNV